MAKGGKVKSAKERLIQGNFYVPSPAEIGSADFSAFRLAEWGVAWPPIKGWKTKLEQNWFRLHPDQDQYSQSPEINSLLEFF